MRVVTFDGTRWSLRAALRMPPSFDDRQEDAQVGEFHEA